MLKRLRELLRRPLLLQPVTARAGDDVILTLPNRLDSDDALALLDAVAQHLPKVRVHLLCGFGEVQVQGKDGAAAGQTAPVRLPALGVARAGDSGHALTITCATGNHLVAVAEPLAAQASSCTPSEFPGITEEMLVAGEAQINWLEEYAGGSLWMTVAAIYKAMAEVAPSAQHPAEMALCCPRCGQSSANSTR